MFKFQMPRETGLPFLFKGVGLEGEGDCCSATDSFFD